MGRKKKTAAERRHPSPGTCALCGFRGAGKALADHLEECVPGRDPKKGSSGLIFHLYVAGEQDPEYWLDLEVAGDSSLRDLDQYLRDIWLECCGHLSAFTIGGQRYAVDVGEEFAPLFPGEAEDNSLNFSLAGALGAGIRHFQHEYDYGSTTSLVLEVVSRREGKRAKGAVRLLARNDPPKLRCAACPAPATLVCSGCYEGPERFACARHAARHECGEDYFLPLVNSPRTGVCGYGG